MQQTFIAILEDENKKMIDFERFADKRLATVTQKILSLYSENSSYYFLYRPNIEKASFLAIYETPNGYNDYIEKVRYNHAELLQLIKQ